MNGTDRNAKLKRFLAWPSGAVMSILERYPAEASFYVALGTLVWVIAFLGLCGMTLNLRTMGWSAASALFGGFVWFLIILNLDRFLLMVRTDGTGWINKAKLATRIVMALCLAVIVGESIIQYVLKNDIRKELASAALAAHGSNHSKALDAFPELQSLRKEKAEKESDIRSKAKEISVLRDLYITEAEGNAVSGLRGKGPLYEQKKENYEAAVKEKEKLEQELAATELRIGEKEKQLGEVLEPVNTAARNESGFLANHRALFAIMRREPTAGILYGAISLVMVLLEITPLLAKLGRKRSIYETTLSQQEETIIELSQTQGEIQRYLLSKVYAEIRAGRESLLVGAEAKVAESMLSNARYFINVELDRQACAGREAASQGTLTAVTVTHPAAEDFDVLFPATADILAGELLAALKTLEPSFSAAGRPVRFDGFTAHTDEGMQIQPALKLLPQIGASMRVHFRPIELQAA